MHILVRMIDCAFSRHPFLNMLYISPSFSIYIYIFYVYFICMPATHITILITFIRWWRFLYVSLIKWEWVFGFWWRNFSFTIVSLMGTAKLDGHWTRIPVTSIIFDEMEWGLGSICWIRFARGYDCFHIWCRRHLLKFIVIVRTLKNYRVWHDVINIFVLTHRSLIGMKVIL